MLLLMSDYIDIPSTTHTGPGVGLVRVRADSPEAVAWLAAQSKPRVPHGPGTELMKLLKSWGYKVAEEIGGDYIMVPA